MIYAAAQPTHRTGRPTHPMNPLRFDVLGPGISAFHGFDVERRRSSQPAAVVLEGSRVRSFSKAATAASVRPTSARVTAYCSCKRGGVLGAVALTPDSSTRRASC